MRAVKTIWNAVYQRRERHIENLRYNHCSVRRVHTEWNRELVLEPCRDWWSYCSSERDCCDSVIDWWAIADSRPSWVVSSCRLGLFRRDRWGRFLFGSLCRRGWRWIRIYLMCWRGRWICFLLFFRGGWLVCRRCFCVWVLVLGIWRWIVWILTIFWGRAWSSWRV